MSLYSRQFLVQFLSTRGPENHPGDDRLALVDRICCVRTILQASGEGWGPKISERDFKSACKASSMMDGNFLRGDYSETIWSTWADQFIARIRREVGVSVPAVPLLPCVCRDIDGYNERGCTCAASEGP